jgi:hypothetical protein
LIAGSRRGRAPGLGRACRRAVGTVLATLALIAVTFSPGRIAVAAQKAAAATETCSFATAGTGTYARSLCWFDLTHYDAALVASPGGQAMTV